MTELREEKRHRIRDNDHTGEDVAVSINKATRKIEMKLWMKWGVTLVCVLLSIIGWFSADFIAKLRADAADGPKAMALISSHQIEANGYIIEFKEMQREQKRMVRNVDRMTVFFETRFGMPREVRTGRRAIPTDVEE